MKKLWAAILGFGVALPASAWAYSRDFTLVNHTGYTISQLYFSYPSYDRWVPSRIPIVPPEERVTIHFDNDGPCDLQFRLTTQEGNTADFMRPFNFCALRTLTIYYNNETRVFTANSSD
jgi:hypothetical protein